MKTLRIVWVFALLAVISASNAQEKLHFNHDHSKMEEQKISVDFDDRNVAMAFEHYSHLKNDLVGSNPVDAQKAAVMLGNALDQIAGSDRARAAAEQISGTEDLKSQRKAFSQLSEAMEPIVRKSIRSGKIYKDFCPMALNGGAYWLSSIEDIRNPYFGAQMLSCGKVEEIIQ